jgi:hypothetical protein
MQKLGNENTQAKWNLWRKNGAWGGTGAWQVRQVRGKAATCTGSRSARHAFGLRVHTLWSASSARRPALLAGLPGRRLRSGF